MSDFTDKLRAAGEGRWVAGDVEHLVIGHPHPLWQEMCDVIDDAAKLEWNLERGRSPWWPRRRLRDAIEALTLELDGPSPVSKETT